MGTPGHDLTVGRRILVVDDDPQVRTLVTRILERHGHRCTEASGAAEARHALADAPPDLVLCDVRMPGESGLGLLEYLRGEFPLLPVVMLSGIGELDIALMSLELGAYGWVTKPFDQSQLLIAVANALIRAGLEQQTAEHEDRLEQAVVERTVQLQDIVHRLVESEQRLQQLADHDQLTGLVNRRRFEAELGRELARASRYESRGAVLSVDLDNFKLINDSAGHSTGDAMLLVVAGVMRERFRSSDIVARVGGDEFAVLLPAVDAEDARAAAESLRRALHAAAAVVEGRSFRVTASIGITEFSEQNLRVDEVLVEADLAMYDAKHRGRDCTVVYTPDQAREARERAKLTWSHRIRDALDGERFVLHSQPILEIATGRISHAELLLRMTGEHGRLVPPGAFLPAAERFGLVHAIDRWVIERAIAELAGQAPDERLPLCVNLSAQSVVGDHQLLCLIAERTAANAVAPGELIFEITETAAISNMKEAREFAHELRELGSQLALDDFGTGFGSFYYLKHLPVDYLKMDGEFIRNLPRSSVDEHMVRAIVEVAKGLDIRTVAEFVGDDETIDLLRLHQVDYAQGFHVGRPGPLADLRCR